jgi:hypothetical protein
MEANRWGLTPQQIRRYNSETMHLLSLYLNLLPDIITPDAIEELVRDADIEREYAYAMMLASVCGLDIAGRDRAYFEAYFVPMIREMDPFEFEIDPYYDSIRIPEKKLGKWELKMMELRPCEAFVRDDFCVYPDGRMIPQIGFFMRTFPYPAALEGGREWMTLMPNETNTTKPAINFSEGKVLTYGLGLGYFAYMSALKENVESVTVVERSRDVIDLVKKYILPQLPNPEKLEIVESDAFEFAEKRMQEGGYNTVFTDIWHDPSDGCDLYLRMKTYEKLLPDAKFVYWVEDTLKLYI